MLIFYKNIKINYISALYSKKNTICGFNIYNLIIQIIHNVKTKVKSHLYSCSYI